MSVLISVVSPVYKAEGIVPVLVQRLKESLQKITESYEIILVEDGSPDRSWQEIEEACRSDQRIKGIKLSRNFGQHNAIFAGLEHAKGEWVVVMDCDLQDRPEEIAHFYEKAKEGYDIVIGARVQRQDNWLKKFFSIIFYKILSYLTSCHYDHQTTNFGIYSRKSILSILAMPETFKIFPMMIQWAGFQSIKISVQHDPRYKGKTSYSFSRLIRFGVQIILSYSDRLLRMIVKLGFSVSLISFLIAMYYLYGHFSGHIVVPGYASIIVSIWFLSGLIIATLGIIGLYIGQIFENTKRRPYALTDKLINIHE